MVEFIAGFSTKSDIYPKWLKRTLMKSLKESLDTNGFIISSSETYYHMIRKAFEFWDCLLKQKLWGHSLEMFKDCLFESFEHQLKTLDISYKKVIEEE